MNGTVENPLAPDAVVVWDAGLEALVGLSGALAAGSRIDLGPWLQEAFDHSDPVEVEEVLVQSYLFLGFPAALNALAHWRRLSGRQAPPEEGAEADVSDWTERGEVTCRAVYGSAYEALRGNIGRMKPEMERWMLVEGYGKVLSRPGLSLGRRECCIAAVLAVQDVPVQLRSHLRGALRCGASVEVVEAVVASVESFQDAGARARTRETLSEVLSSRGARG